MPKCCAATRRSHSLSGICERNAPPTRRNSSSILFSDVVESIVLSGRATRGTKFPRTACPLNTTVGDLAACTSVVDTKLERSETGLGPGAFVSLRMTPVWVYAPRPQWRAV